MNEVGHENDSAVSSQDLDKCRLTSKQAIRQSVVGRDAIGGVALATRIFVG
mgnify:CR=1 FL=1